MHETARSLAATVILSRALFPDGIGKISTQNRISVYKHKFSFVSRVLIQISLVSLWKADKFAKNVAILLLKEIDMPTDSARHIKHRTVDNGKRIAYRSLRRLPEWSTAA